MLGHKKSNCAPACANVARVVCVDPLQAVFFLRFHSITVLPSDQHTFTSTRSPPSPLDCQIKTGILKSVLINIFVSAARMSACVHPSSASSSRSSSLPAASRGGCTPPQGTSQVLHRYIPAVSTLHLFQDSQGPSHHTQTLPPIFLPGHGEVHQSRDPVKHLSRLTPLLPVISMCPFVVQDLHRHPSPFQPCSLRIPISPDSRCPCTNFMSCPLLHSIRRSHLSTRRSRSLA